MARKHHVVIVHGMGNRRSDELGYSLPLQRGIAGHLGEESARIQFHEVNWSDIGQLEEDRLLEEKILPDQWHSFDFFKLGDSLLESFDRATGLSNQLRNFLVSSVGDVFTYLTTAGKQIIQARLKQKIFQARDAQIAAGDPAPHFVSIAAHSLGSVVTYDLARYFGDSPDGQLEIGSARLANLFTFGSPLALFSLLEYGQNRQVVGDGAIEMLGVLSDGQSPQVDPHPYSKRGIRLDFQQGKWLNFYDQQDVIACTLAQLYGHAAPIDDIPVQTGSIHAHTSYWGNDEMARQIAAQLRLTLAAL
jgi:hypothetical protein